MGENLVKKKTVIAAGAFLVVLILFVIFWVPDNETGNSIVEDDQKDEVEEVVVTESQIREFETLKRQSEEWLVKMRSHLGEVQSASLRNLAGKAQTLREDGLSFWSEVRPALAIKTLKQSVNSVESLIESIPLQNMLTETKSRYAGVFQQSQENLAYKFSREFFLRASEIAENAEKSVEAGTFRQAIDFYEESIRLFEEANDDVISQVEKVKASAWKAYHDNLQDEAIQYSQKWIEYQPRNEDAKEMLKRSEVLNQVLQFTHKGNQYLLQQQPVFAKESFESALTLDSHCEPAKNGLNEAMKSINELTLLNALKAYNDAIDEEDYEFAFEHVEKASSVAKDDGRVVLLRESFDSRYRPLIVDEKVSAGRELMESGEYKEAIAYAEDALSWFADSEAAVQLNKNAREAYKNSLTARKYIETGMAKMESDKLQDIQDSLLYFEKAVELDPRSEEFRQKLEKCKQLIDTMMVPLSVVLKSDGQSNVHIFKVGKFEPFDSKEIILKPGTYQIKVKRRGYRDGFYTISIKPGLLPEIPFLTTDGKI